MTGRARGRVETDGHPRRAGPKQRTPCESRRIEQVDTLQCGRWNSPAEPATPCSFTSTSAHVNRSQCCPSFPLDSCSQTPRVEDAAFAGLRRLFCTARFTVSSTACLGELDLRGQRAPVRRRAREAPVPEGRARSARLEGRSFALAVHGLRRRRALDTTRSGGHARPGATLRCGMCGNARRAMRSRCSTLRLRV